MNLRRDWSVLGQLRSRTRELSITGHLYGHDRYFHDRFARGVHSAERLATGLVDSERDRRIDPRRSECRDQTRNGSRSSEHQGDEREDTWIVWLDLEQDRARATDDEPAQPEPEHQTDADLDRTLRADQPDDVKVRRAERHANSHLAVPACD